MALCMVTHITSNNSHFYLCFYLVCVITKESRYLNICTFSHLCLFIQSVLVHFHFFFLLIIYLVLDAFKLVHM